ncbi:hypothetical protein FPHOBKDP_00123 [Listeria phage LPJP1]|nr:hypothetical protein FPHOBKDP_00123 [Listeria phage LPJP1]
MYLNHFVDLFSEIYPDITMKENDKSIVSAINTIMYIVTECINETYYKYGMELGIPEDKRGLINMKNEFLYKRLMLTDAQKNYAGVILMQEGNILQTPKIDIKGLAIKKTNTNKHVREEFSGILKDVILESDKIDGSEFITRYKNLEKEIRRSLMNSEITFTLPRTANIKENYVAPYTQAPYKGVLVWNTLYPDKEINLPNKVNLIKLNIETFDDIESKTNDQDLIERFKKVYEDEELTKKGITYIAIEAEQKHIPEEIIPFIDIPEMVKTHVSSGSKLMTSLGFNPLVINGSLFPTNIINF